MSNDKERVAIVTGGSKGIGRAIALELAKYQYYVIVNYRSDISAAKETIGLMENEGFKGELSRFDVSDAEESKEAIDQIISRFKNIEVLVNNAGITADGLFVMMPEKDWDAVITTTLKGFYNVTKPVMKRMIPKKRGSIVSISSVAGLIGNRGQANYSAAKAGLIGATKALALEVAKRNVLVNCVAPGFIETEMTDDLPKEQILPIIPFGRFGSAKEVADVVGFLCSERASYITGQVIGVNGGTYM